MHLAHHITSPILSLGALSLALTSAVLPTRLHAGSDAPALNTAAPSSAPGAEGHNDEDLAKQLANPVASLISAPFQANWDFGIGVNDASRFTLNIQPVVPIDISTDWNLIIRTILPVIDAESPAPGIDDASGLGDTVQSFFFSPKAPVGGWILAAGPVALWPTATDTQLGSEHWGAGPTVLGLKQSGPWTVGMLANHIWSYAGDDDRPDVNSTFLQPFCAYITKTKTTFTLNSESTYDWVADQWTVPMNFIISQMFRVGKLPMQASVGGRYYLEKPEGGPEWGLRAVVTFLFPKG